MLFLLLVWFNYAWILNRIQIDTKHVLYVYYKTIVWPITHWYEMNDTHEASCFAENLQSSRRMLVKNKDAGDIPTWTTNGGSISKIKN